MMSNKPITPKIHGLIDYALAGSLLLLPSCMGLTKKVRKIYTAESLILLGYIAITDHPTALRPLIPFTTHGKIDPFNVAQFALQSFFKPFKKDKKAQVFNIVFTVAAALTVVLTDWSGPTKQSPSVQIRSRN